MVFKLSPSGTETVLHSFVGSDGAGPGAGLIADSAGNLYGTTRFGGASNSGVVFKLTGRGSSRSRPDCRKQRQSLWHDGEWRCGILPWPGP